MLGFLRDWEQAYEYHPLRENFQEIVFYSKAPLIGTSSQASMPAPQYLPSLVGCSVTSVNPQPVRLVHRELGDHQVRAGLGAAGSRPCSRGDAPGEALDAGLPHQSGGPLRPQRVLRPAQESNVGQCNECDQLIGHMM